MKRVLILGGGFGGVEAYQQIHKLCHPCAEKEIKVELINRSNYLTFSPMLHEVATGSVSRENIMQPIRELMKCCDNVFHQAEIVKIDLINKQVVTDKRKHGCDVLVVALGAEQGFFGVPGAKEYSYSLKTMQNAIDMRNRIIMSFERASESFASKNIEILKRQLNFVIVGGGATGVELAGQLADLVHGDMKSLYPDIKKDQARITLIHGGDRLLDYLPRRVSLMAQRRLEKLGVKVMLNLNVTEVMCDGVLLDEEKKLLSGNVFWAAGTETSLRELIENRFLNKQGFLVTDKFREVIGVKDVFGLGDGAVVDNKGFRTSSTAQAAVWEAKIVARNILRDDRDKSVDIKSYKSRGDIIPIGDWYAVFVKGRIVIVGRLAWLMRRTIFLLTMYGWGDRLRVAAEWAIGVFTRRDTSKL